MPGNSFGSCFRITTFGESHGPAIGVVIDGVPPKIELNEADIQVDLDRRRPGQSHISTARNEADRVEILSGVFEGKTTGTPIACLIHNEDADSSAYAELKDKFRPGHADFTYFAKYGIRDYRGGGRASGRETACRVAAGAIAKKILKQNKITITAYTTEIAGISAQNRDLGVIETNAVRCPDADAAKKMIEAIEAAAQKGDSLGGIVEGIVLGCPAGLGEPIFNKIDALLAHALLSIGAVKGIEFGDGFELAKRTGSAVNDAFYIQNNQIKTKTNHAGGILGGITTGEPIVLRIAIKPTASIASPQKTVTTSLKETEIMVQGRHDPCICPRIVPVVEAMMAITIVDALMQAKL